MARFSIGGVDGDTHANNTKNLYAIFYSSALNRAIPWQTLVIEQEWAKGASSSKNKALDGDTFPG